jgi:2-dehydropantoate 2-reductase
MASSAPFFMEPLHILGSGSIGLLWASCIRSAFPSYPLRALFREHYREIIGEDEDQITVCLRKQNSGPRMAFVPIEYIGGEKLRRRNIQNLILSTKAWGARDAIESILPILDTEGSEKFNLTILCNGALDVREQILKLFEKHKKSTPNLITCTTTHGVYQEPPDGDMFHLVQKGMGRTFLSSSGFDNTETAQDMAKMWDRAGLNTSFLNPDQMEVLLWQKLAANCFCNPLTALYQCTNGQLMDKREFGSLRKQLIREVSEVAISLNPELQENLSPSAMQDFVQLVIRDNMDNTSSMQRDVKSKKPTEIDHLNGFIVRKSQALNIECPANEELYEKITEITRGSMH